MGGTRLVVNLLHPEKDGGLFSCVASNLAGRSEHSRSVRVERLSDWEHETVRTLLVVVLVTSAGLVVLLGVVCYCCRRHRLAKDELNSADIALFLHGDPASINPSLPVEEQATLLPYDQG